MPRETKAARRARAAQINAILAETYPDAKCALNFRNPFELLVATILSAQCTDERVNKVTPGLFAEYPDAASMAAAPPEHIEELIHSTGFFRNKAKSLLGMSAAVVERFGGEIPSTMEELRELPGVGRKTANVVLGNCFGVPGMPVDTHMIRVNNRLGLTKNSEPEKVERDLMDIVPEREWTMYSHHIILHGRAICVARKPKCSICPVAELCVYFNTVVRRAK